ncbi:MAG: serine/threonine-protein kinase [Myxococcaceae bacterium]
MIAPTATTQLTPLAAEATEVGDRQLPPPPDSANLTGQMIGEYQIMSRIGAGGMGVVYEGRHPLIGKRVAVKVLLPQHTSNESQVSRFLSEARAVNEARHRGIVDIFSFGQLPDGAHYFVMEYLEGEGFDRLIKQRAPILVGEALLWTAEVLEALSAAHEVGIIHRDIKPSNLFLVSTGRGRPYVKVLDFGIAKVAFLTGEQTPTTRASVVVGTPEYMAPEQVRGVPTSPATDLYGVGCVLFEMLTGRRLFMAGNSTREMWMHLDDPPPRAAEFNPSVPSEVDDLLQWVLRKDASERPQSADELRHHVEDLLRALPEALAPQASAAFSGRPAPVGGLWPSASALTPVPSFGKAMTVLEGAVERRGPRASAAVALAARPTGRSRAAWLVLAALVAVTAGLGGWAVRRQGEVPPSRAPAAAVAQPAALLPAAAPPGPEAPRPAVSTAPKVPSKTQLFEGLIGVESALLAREESSGERDRVLRPLLEQARLAVARADTKAQRRSASAFLDELAAQLEP